MNHWCREAGPPSPAEQYESTNQRDTTGLTFGEHEICWRLDRIIELLSAAREEQASA